MYVLSFGNYTMCNIEKLARQFLLGRRNSNNIYKVKFATCAPIMHAHYVPLQKNLNFIFAGISPFKGIWIPENFCLWNAESGKFELWNLESGIQLKGSH